MIFKSETDYYADKAYISNSMIGRLLDNEYLFNEWMNGRYVYEPTEPMAMGNLIHNKFFEYLKGEPIPDTQEIIVVDDYDRRTKAGKEKHLEIAEKYKGQMVLKKFVYDQCVSLVDALTYDRFINEYFEEITSEYAITFEIQKVGEVNGMKAKGKADIICTDINGDICKIIDLKTTSSISGFTGSVRKYGYNRQWIFYAKLFGLNPYDDVFDFLTVEKQTGRTALFKTGTERFVNESERALEFGVDKMNCYLEGDVLDLKTRYL